MEPYSEYWEVVVFATITVAEQQQQQKTTEFNNGQQTKD